MERSEARSVFLLAYAALLAGNPSVRAVVPLTKPPIPQRVASADCVVLGKVKSLEPKLVHAAPPLKVRGVDTIPYQMAVLTVQSALIDAKDQREIRVGYVPPPSKGGSARFRRYAQVELAVDQEGCFFLQKHPDDAFYLLQASYNLLDRASEKNYESDLGAARHGALLLQDPDNGLKAEKLTDRRLTAAMLLFRYRTPRYVYTGAPTTEPIDAAQSKLILETLLECDWSETESPSPMAGLNLFLRLGLTQEDGWIAPQAASEYPAAAQKWLRRHGGTYRIQRYVKP
jgi:hypothetical protein